MIIIRFKIVTISHFLLKTLTLVTHWNRLTEVLTSAHNLCLIAKISNMCIHNAHHSQPKFYYIHVGCNHACKKTWFNCSLSVLFQYSYLTGINMCLLYCRTINRPNINPFSFFLLTLFPSKSNMCLLGSRCLLGYHAWTIRALSSPQTNLTISTQFSKYCFIAFLHNVKPRRVNKSVTC